MTKNWDRKKERKKGGETSDGENLSKVLRRKELGR